MGAPWCVPGDEGLISGSPLLRRMSLLSGGILTKVHLPLVLSLFQRWSGRWAEALAMTRVVSSPGSGGRVEAAFASMVDTGKSMGYGVKVLHSTGMGEGLIDIAVGRTSGTRGSDLVML